MTPLPPSVVMDTNVVSYALKRDTRVALYAPYLATQTRFVSFITTAELYYWAEDRRWGPRLRRDLDALLRTFDVIHSDEALCRLWAQTRHVMKRKGLVISLNDAWVAGTALYLDAPLVTHNRRDFAAVPGLHLLPEAT